MELIQQKETKAGQSPSALFKDLELQCVNSRGGGKTKQRRISETLVKTTMTKTKKKKSQTQRAPIYESCKFSGPNASTRSSPGEVKWCDIAQKELGQQHPGLGFPCPSLPCSLFPMPHSEERSR